MESDKFLSLLRCPHCAENREGQLTIEPGKWLVCQETGCNRKYIIHEGLPLMVTTEGDFLGYRARVMDRLSEGLEND